MATVGAAVAVTLGAGGVSVILDQAVRDQSITGSEIEGVGFRARRTMERK